MPDPSAPDPGDDDAPRRRFAGRYTVHGPLGSGAMGTVWACFDDILQRRVALKELKFPEGIPAGEELEMRERIMREARALAGLSHPNVVTVFDVLDIETDPLVVMELVPSKNLASATSELGRLDRSQAAVVGYGTAAALRAAHKAGITHRDVKPGNVLISDDGRIKLTDFGIARNESDAPMTSAGLVLGSPAYIAPEVAAGRPVTPAADLWGLGATLFAAVEGRPPYDVDGDPVKTITEVVDGDVPRLSEPGPLADVVHGLMVKEPGDRMPLDEVRARLRPLLDDPDDPIFPGSPDVPTIMARLPRSATSPGTAARTTPPTTPPTAPPAPAVSPRPAPAPPPAAASQGSVPVVPGPLQSPTGPPPQPVPRQAASARRTRPVGVLGAIPLVLGGAVLVLGGALGGYTGVRALAGQEPMSTISVATDRTPRSVHPDPLGFTVLFPENWSQYRATNDDGSAVVRFVSPDGRQELMVQGAASAKAVLDSLNPRALGVDTVDSVTPRQAARGITAVRMSTTDDGRRRISLLRIIPRSSGNGVWVLQLTSPAGLAEHATSQLFDTIADGFRTSGA
ncbi:serine/threonine-protein kinase [Pseudonocardia phyllosphaerae]|uniref:serine/threonine-protein kinase n=1 Tax=Pseudonocardia phyllosphaerae TaxID=3390502 RepID=UPI00397A4D8F